MSQQLAHGYVSYVPPVEFDMAVEADAISDLTHLIQSCPWIVIDLRGVTFMDSAGISALLWARRHSLERGGGVALVGAHPRVLRLLELTQLDHVFPVYSSFDDLPAMPAAGQPVG